MAFKLLMASLAAAVAVAKDTCTSGSPTSTTTTAHPTSTVSSHFRLVANVSFSDLDSNIQPWTVSSYHIGPCYDYAVLLPEGAGASDYSRAFYVNGTDNEVKKNTGDLLTDGGTPSIPYGVIIPQFADADDEGRRAVHITCGEGTDGVYVSRRGQAPRLSYDNQEAKEAFGSWYGCNTTLPYGPAIVLYYRDDEKKTPRNCMDVTLFTECVKKVSAISGYARAAPCEPSVVSD